MLQCTWRSTLFIPLSCFSSLETPWLHSHALCWTFGSDFLPVTAAHFSFYFIWYIIDVQTMYISHLFSFVHTALPSDNIYKRCSLTSQYYKLWTEPFLPQETLKPQLEQQKPEQFDFVHSNRTSSKSLTPLIKVAFFPLFLRGGQRPNLLEKKHGFDSDSSA